MSHGRPGDRPVRCGATGDQGRRRGPGVPCGDACSAARARNVAGLYRCEATFGNWGNVDGQIGFLYFDRALLEFGKDFAIKLGDASRSSTAASPRLEAHFPEGRPPEIAVLAEDRFQDLRMTRRTRTFADMSDADVMSSIARDHGLTPQIDVDRTDPQGAGAGESERPGVPARARARDRRRGVGRGTERCTRRRAHAAQQHAGRARLSAASCGSSPCSPISPRQRTSVHGQRLGRGGQERAQRTRPPRRRSAASSAGDASGVSILKRSARRSQGDARARRAARPTRSAGARRGATSRRSRAASSAARRGRDRSAAARRRSRRT